MAAYCFGRFELNPATRQLLVEGQPVTLGARAFDVLLALIERRGRLISKSDLLDAAWPGLAVEENNLQVQVSTLRKVVGERTITTVPGRGYQFTAEVTEAQAPVRKGLPRSNVPRRLTRFIGHEADLGEYEKTVTTNRLVTLTGVGGCGKTRLACEIASRLLPTYADGAWFVDLAPMADAERLALTVAKTLGINEHPGRPVVETLCEHLDGHKILLVLDNCEHVVAACATLAQTLLGRASQLTVVATSRERLDVIGECTLRVRSLFCPPAEGDAFDQIQAFEAVQLFVDRAQLVQRGFALSPATAPAVADICRRLDGIPLAIELAAARVRSLSVQEVSQRLDQRFHLLLGGPRTVIPRQQTLRALIDWSYDLLNTGEQALLRRVAVFAGGWTLEAAEAVCAGEIIDKDSVFDLLTCLVDKSLIVTEQRERATRYRLLETVREYARDRLRASGEEDICQRRHLAFFTEMAEEAEPHLSDADQPAWLERLEIEHDNLRSALTWCTAADGDVSLGLRIAGALYRFWWRGHFSEGRTFFSKLLGAVPNGQAAVRAKALVGAGTIAWQQGDHLSARLHFEESLALRRQLHDVRGIAESLTNLGLVAFDQGDFRLSTQHHEEGLAIRRQLDDQRGIAVSLENLGVNAREQGHYASARTLLEESIAMFRELGDRWALGVALCGLGGVALDTGDYSGGRTHYEESLRIRREIHDQWGIAWSLEGLAYVASALNAPGRAARLWGAAERLREKIGTPLQPTERRRYERHVVAARAVIGDDRAFDSAWQEGRAVALEQSIAYALAREG